MSDALSADDIARMKAVVGPRGWVDDPAEAARYLTDHRALYHGRAALVLRPHTTAAAAEIIALCNRRRVGVTPQGGNTSYMGAATPDQSGRQVVLSLERMNRIRELDTLNATMTVEAGCVLADVQAAAARAERLFPLSLAAEGTCQIGGVLSTNAGGVAVLRYGNARDLTLGLEVVLPDGRVWDGLSALRKDNAGYDLKHAFIGAEGTLGVITAAVLKLYPKPNAACTTLLAVASPAAAVRLLRRMQTASDGAVSSFEYMHRACLDMVFCHIPATSDPLAQAHEHYVLCELTTARAGPDLRAAAEEALADALEGGDVMDGTIAASAAQTQALWRLRESISEAQRVAGASIKHDVSVAVSRAPDFLKAATAAVRAAAPGARVAPFGHVGDGNLHFNVCAPKGADNNAFLAHAPQINRLVHDIVADMRGSFSAEHGVGQLKRGELERYKSPVALDLMRALKAAFDPNGVMNPGKVV